MRVRVPRCELGREPGPPCLYAALAGLLGAAAPAAAQPAVEIQVNQTADTRDDYIGWSPALARIRVSQANGATEPVAVVLRNQNPAVGGQVRFAAFQNPGPRGPRRRWTSSRVPSRSMGAGCPFVVAGRYGRPSTRDRDAVIQTARRGTGRRRAGNQGADGAGAEERGRPNRRGTEALP